MAKIAFFSFPSRGHIHPTLAVIKELVRRGEEITYFSTKRFRTMIRDTGARFGSYPPEVAMPDRGPGPFARVTSTVETLCAFSRTILDHQLAPLQAFQPTHILFDSFAPWGMFLARSLGLPAIASVPSILINAAIDARYGREQPTDASLSPDWYASIRTRSELLPTAPRPEELLQTYGDFNIVYTSRLFQPMAAVFDDRFEFVGPCFEFDGCIPPQLDDDRPLILISLGTVYGNQDFFRRCSEELAGGPWRTVTLDGSQSQASQIGLLRRCAVFLTHGGMNSVQEALYHGVPMILAPQAADQFWISARVAELGAGIRLGGIRECVNAILSNPEYRVAAQRIGQSLRAAGGHMRAADTIQSFMTRSARSATLASDINVPAVRPGVR
jgi:MGT family glycosyltransferase